MLIPFTQILLLSNPGHTIRLQSGHTAYTTQSQNALAKSGRTQMVDAEEVGGSGTERMCCFVRALHLRR